MSVVNRDVIGKGIVKQKMPLIDISESDDQGSLAHDMSERSRSGDSDHQPPKSPLRKRTNVKSSESDHASFSQDKSEKSISSSHCARMRPNNEEVDSQYPETPVRERATLQSQKSDRTISTHGWHHSPQFGRKASVATRAWTAPSTDMNEWQAEDVNAFKPWEEDSLVAKEFIKALDSKQVLSTWESVILWWKESIGRCCSEDIKRVWYSIDIALESFAW